MCFKISIPIKSMPTQFSSQVPQVEISGDGFIPNSPNHPNPIESMYAICGNIYIHLPSIYPLYVSIYTSTMDPSWDIR
jgi:hypothetical protein